MMISTNGSPECEDLQNFANYRFVSKTLKPAGIGSVIFGIIAIAMGFGGVEGNPLNAILGLIGVFLLVDGIWIVFFPTTKGMIVDSIALFIVGVWNILITIANAYAGGNNDPQIFAIIGVCQIIGGFRRLGLYKRYSAMPMSKPSDETLRRINDIAKTIKRAKAKQQSDIVVFKTQTFISQKEWKGRLSQNSAVFVDGTGNDIVFTPKTDVDFVKQGKVLLGKTIKASFRIRDREMTGTIAPVFLDRFDEWKSST